MITVALIVSLTDRIRSDYTTGMIIRNISDAKAELSHLVEQVLQGESVIINRAGKPVVRLIPYIGKTQKRKLGVLAGKIKMLAGFDDLPDDIAESFGIK